MDPTNEKGSCLCLLRFGSVMGESKSLPRFVLLQSFRWSPSLHRRRRRRTRPQRSNASNEAVWHTIATVSRLDTNRWVGRRWGGGMCVCVWLLAGLFLSSCSLFFPFFPPFENGRWLVGAPSEGQTKTEHMGNDYTRNKSGLA